MPSNDAFPPPARPPVCGMLIPILIGACCACSRLIPSGEAANAAPLAVASRRRREIDPDLETLFDIGCFSSPCSTVWRDRIWFCRRRPSSDSSQGRQDNLRREGNLRDYCPERL